MANPVYIDEVYTPGTDLWGFHAYDNYDECSAFNWEKLPEDDKEWFYQILTHENGYPEAFGEMVQFVRENDTSFIIRGNYYSWGDMAHTYEMARLAQIADVVPPTSP